MAQTVSAGYRRSWLITLWAAVAPAVAGAAVVRTADDAKITGTLISVANGALVVSVPTTRPTTRASDGAVTIALEDVAEVTLRDAPAPKPAAPAAAPPKPKAKRPSRGLFAAIVGSLVGSDDNSNDNGPDEAPVAAVADVPVAPVRPTGPAAWQVVLADGGHLHGTLDKWADGTLTLRTPVSADKRSLEIPADRVTEVWIADPATQAKARSLLGTPGADDVALVQKDATTIVPVTGTALGSDGESLRFQYDGRERKLAVAKLVGVVLGGHRTADGAAKELRFTAGLGNGDAITGTWVAVDADRLTLRTNWGQPFALALPEVLRMQAVGGRLAYLSDLKPASIEQVPYFGRLVPYRLDRSLTGGPIVLADGTHDKGIAVHARCRLEYDLAGGFDRFRAIVGFEQPTAKRGSAAIQVLADGRSLYDAPDARGDGPTVPLDLDVTHVRRLTLLVDFGSGRDVLARVDWADARLLRRPSPSTRPTAQEGRP